MYADKITDSMKITIDETERRRQKQREYNEEHNINPETVFKTREEIMRSTLVADAKSYEEPTFAKPKHFERMSNEDQIMFMTAAMKKAAENLDFETAMLIRDEIDNLKKGQKKIKNKK